MSNACDLYSAAAGKELRGAILRTGCEYWVYREGLTPDSGVLCTWTGESFLVIGDLFLNPLHMTDEAPTFAFAAMTP